MSLRKSVEQYEDTSFANNESIPLQKLRPIATSGRNVTVLLVDDDEFIRDVTTEILMSNGYKVILAKNGAEALQLYRLHMDLVDAVFLDLNMPRMNGEEALCELMKMNNDVNVIISSGYCEEEVKERFLCKGAVAFIQKPYNFSVLTQTLELIISSNGEV